MPCSPIPNPVNSPKNMFWNSSNKDCLQRNLVFHASDTSLEIPISTSQSDLRIVIIREINENSISTAGTLMFEWSAFGDQQFNMWRRTETSSTRIILSYLIRHQTIVRFVHGARLFKHRIGPRSFLLLEKLPLESGYSINLPSQTMQISTIPRPTTPTPQNSPSNCPACLIESETGSQASLSDHDQPDPEAFTFLEKLEQEKRRGQEVSDPTST